MNRSKRSALTLELYFLMARMNAGNGRWGALDAHAGQREALVCPPRIPIELCTRNSTLSSSSAFIRVPFHISSTPGTVKLRKSPG